MAITAVSFSRLGNTISVEQLEADNYQIIVKDALNKELTRWTWHICDIDDINTALKMMRG